MEYCCAAESLQEDGFGRIVEFQVPRASASSKVFIEVNHSRIQTQPLLVAQHMMLFPNPFTGT